MWVVAPGCMWMAEAHVSSVPRSDGSKESSVGTATLYFCFLARFLTTISSHPVLRISLQVRDRVDVGGQVKGKVAIASEGAYGPWLMSPI